MPTLKEFIRKKTASFVKKNVRGDIDETPLAKVYKMCERSRTPGYVHIKRMLDYPEKNLHDLKLRLTNEAGNKATTYREINASLSVHPVYRSNRYIDERKRVVFTKFRTSSHSLKVETGRWSRVLRENRLCGCGVGVQDEHHVVFDCAKSEDVRFKYGINVEVYGSVGELMDNHDCVDLVDFVNECMQLF